jgi:hypothetical protein
MREERSIGRRVELETDLCRKLARFMADNAAQLESSDPKLPDGAFNRIADNWRPLFAIAEIAGGDWPQRVAAAFFKLTNTDDMDAQGIGTTLLADIQQIFENAGVDKLPSATLCNSLAEIEGRDWAEWRRTRKPISTHQLARLLRGFQVSPRPIRFWRRNPARLFTCRLHRCVCPLFARNPVLRVQQCNMNAGLPMKTAKSTCVSKVQHALTLLRCENASFPSCVALLHSGTPAQVSDIN